MPVINRIADLEPELRDWRRHLHSIPELDFDLFKTAAFVEDKLRKIGVDEVHTGIAKTGIVALIKGNRSGPTIGLRADMDALPIHEATGAPHTSTHAGVMHACGHDGHTTALLGAARYLAETRNFAGTAALIFQPSEEMSGGGKVMCDEGIMDRFDIGSVYAFHNAPGIEEGHIGTRVGPIMGAADEFEVTFAGLGGHAAYPHDAVDPIPALLTAAQALYAINARRVDPAHTAVISLTQIQGSSASNIIPETASMAGTIRTLEPEARSRIHATVIAAFEGAAATHGVQAKINFQASYPATVNTEAETAFAAGVACEIVGEDRVDTNRKAELGVEDFSYMLQHRPGAYVFIGAGDRPQVHTPQYDYNDEITPIAASWFVRLVEASG